MPWLCRSVTKPAVRKRRKDLCFIMTLRQKVNSQDTNSVSTGKKPPPLRGAWLNRRNPSGGRKSKRSAILRAAMMEALSAGPATNSEIRKRMGIAPHHSEVSQWLATFERRGLVKKLRWKQTARGPRSVIWSLTVRP